MLRKTASFPPPQQPPVPRSGRPYRPPAHSLPVSALLRRVQAGYEAWRWIVAPLGGTTTIFDLLGVDRHWLLDQLRKAHGADLEARFRAAIAAARPAGSATP